VNVTFFCNNFPGFQDLCQSCGIIKWLNPLQAIKDFCQSGIFRSCEFRWYFWLWVREKSVSDSSLHIRVIFPRSPTVFWSRVCRITTFWIMYAQQSPIFITVHVPNLSIRAAKRVDALPHNFYNAPRRETRNKILPNLYTPHHISLIHVHILTWEPMYLLDIIIKMHGSETWWDYPHTPRGAGDCPVWRGWCCTSYSCRPKEWKNKTIPGVIIAISDNHHENFCSDGGCFRPKCFVMNLWLLIIISKELFYWTILYSSW